MIPPPRPAFDPLAARLVRELKHTRPLVGCRFDPSGRYLFASAEDDTVQRFDVASGAKVAFVGHQSWVRGVAFVAPKSAPATLVTADYHGKLGWWAVDGDTPKPLKIVEAHTGYARAVAVSPDQATVASCGNDHLIKLWAADGKPVRTLEGHESHVYNVVFSPDGSRLVSCDLKGVVKDWNIKTGKAERDIDAKVLTKYDPTFMADIGGARGMAFHPDGGTVAVCGITNVSNAFAGVGNPAVVLIDWTEGKGRLLKLKDAFQGTAWGVCFHPLGGVIAAGGAGQGRVWFWKHDDTNVHVLNVPANCRDLTLSLDGTRFAVAGANGTAYVYDFGGGPPAAPPAKK
jgi:WD40 repeat protein